jgi:flagella basal body P-ring formation protein FlgA
MTHLKPLIVSLVLAMLVARVVPTAAAQGADQAPTLKASATVTGEIVRIGDLVEHAGAVADVPIFRSPDLGQTGSVPVERVLDAVLQHHIIGLDTRGLAEVEVTRASRTITVKDVQAQILRALGGKYGLPDTSNLTVVLDSDMQSLEVEPAATKELAVTRLSYEPRNGRFDITFNPPGSATARRSALHFTGTLTETFDAVVSLHELVQGQALKASDVGIERRPKSEFTPTTLISLDQVQGLSAKHGLHASQVLRQTDVSKPELVGRNETVTIVYEVPGIRLTVLGKSAEPGGLGDSINVLNVQSKRTIQATVIGPNRVTVNAATRLAADATQ